MQASVGDISLEYETLGNPLHPVVLLVMGLGQQLVNWPDDFCEALVDGGLCVVRYDHRDTGLSTKMEGAGTVGVVQAFMRRRLGLGVPSPYGLEDLATDAFGLLDHLEVKAAHVVGASMGGMVAQIMAARHPERVQTLTSFMSSSGESHLPPGRPDALALLAAPRPRGNRDAVLDFGVRVRRVLAGRGYPTEESEMRSAIARAVDRMWYPAGLARHTLAVLAAPARERLLRELKVPTLVLHGGDDPLVTPEHGRRTAELVPGAELHVIDGMGHDIPPGARALLARLIVDHIRTHNPL